MALNQVLNPFRVEEHHKKYINQIDESHAKANLVEIQKTSTSSSKKFKSQGNKLKNFQLYRKTSNLRIITLGITKIEKKKQESCYMCGRTNHLA